MFEEVNKLFITGHGYNSFKILRKYNIFELLFPDAGDFLDNKSYIDFVEYALSSSDKDTLRTREICLISYIQ